MADGGMLTRIMDRFLEGNLTVLLIIMAVVAGAGALLMTPREEEPQIVVPLADVFVQYPGGSAEEVERLVASRLERLLLQIDGVEYVYSMSRPGMAVVTVRFFVGEGREKSLIKLYNKILQNVDRVTPGITGWVVKPVEIDDVPVVGATLYSRRHDTHDLYRVAEEVVVRLQDVPDAARITIHGGEPRQIGVYLDMQRLSAYGLTPMEIAGALRAANARSISGTFARHDEVIQVETGPFLASPREVANLMVGLYDGRPVWLKDVARITDGPAEATAYTRLGFGPAGSHSGTYPAVTIAVAKKKGSNAVLVARTVQQRLAAMQGTLIPDGIDLEITRDYGATADDKVNDLVGNLIMGLVTVVGLIWLILSWREGLIVGMTIPVTYALTLFFNYLFGYTINRVTLFALILAMGMLVDNPIVSVENIHRYLAMGRHPKTKAVSLAMREIMPPMTLATFAIIVSFIPMFFITGMMGPYMAPMALNVPLTMVCSMLVAVMITPWLASRIITVPEKSTGADVPPTRVSRFYRRLVSPFLASPRRSATLLFVILILLILSIALALTGLVPLKMLPFDNKNEFQIIVDLPEATTLETTDALVRDIEAFLQGVPEVTTFTATVGTSSPMDFNGLVRHYYLREGPHTADVRVNLADRSRRAIDSHAIALRIRDELTALGTPYGASVKIVEPPPGPPVLSTVVAEVSGTARHEHDELIAAGAVVRRQMERTAGMVDVDDMVEADQERLFFRVDRDKAGLHGINTADIVQTVKLALTGMPAGSLHIPTEVNELPIILRLPRQRRSDRQRLESILVKGRTGQAVELGELGSFTRTGAEKTIMHKNLVRTVFVTAEMAGRGPAYAVLDLQRHFNDHPLPPGTRVNWRGEGEWKITLDVFRDLGLSFSVALLIIYLLLVFETGSYLLPLVIMLSIPLTLIGIMPGFWLLNLLVDRPVAGYANPVFFTATAMIGMIALGGIVQRNAIILIDFIRTSMARGQGLEEAIIASGSVRLRPILLTAGTTMLGVWPITFDPIFSGLGWSIIFGLFVSTLFTLVVVPVTYHLLYRQKPGNSP